MRWFETATSSLRKLDEEKQLENWAFSFDEGFRWFFRHEQEGFCFNVRNVDDIL